MKLFVPDEIDNYAHEHTRPRPALFDELRQYTYDNVPAPQMQVGRVEGTLLKLLATMVGARRILEIGTYTGYSGLCMAEALPDDGELITCDRDPDATAVARKFFDKSPHGGKITIKLGDALETVKALPLRDDRLFDMVFIDADKPRYARYYEEVFPRLRSGGIIVVDNALWSGEVLDPKSDAAKGIAEINDMIQADDRVDNVFLSVRDGVMLARKL